MVYLDKNSANKWLVKSENKILGPYNFEQIEDLVLKKQISLIDEVRDSETRWLYVRENAQFKNIVDAIRKELETKIESTKTYQSFSKTDELSNKTKTDIPHYTDVAMDVQDISVVKEIIHNQQQDQDQFFKEEAGKRDKVKLYGLEQDRAVKNKVTASSFQFLIYLVSVLILIATSLGAFYFYQKYNQQKQEELWVQQIKKYKFLGLEQKATDVYVRLPGDTQKKLLPQVIELLPMLEANGVIQLRDIESLKNQADLSVEQKAQIQLVYFWSAMQAQDLKSAQEAIVKAIALQPASALVKENEALINLKKSQNQKALEIYSDLYKNESSGRYLLGQAISWIGLPPAERTKTMTSISQSIEKYTFIYYDYKKELLLAQLVFAKLEKNEALFQSTWKQFISTPCQLSNQFKKPLLLAPQSYLWKNLSEYLNLLKPYLNAEELVIFDLHNLFELGQTSEAVQYNTQNNSKVKDQKLRQQLNLLVYHFQSRFSDLLALEKTNQLDPQSDLNHLVLALAKIEENPSADISKHLQFFKSNQMSFYEDWLTLAQLVKQKSLEPIKVFTRNHFLTVNNFIPALEAKSMVE